MGPKTGSLRVTEADEGGRLDLFLKGRLPGTSRKKVKALLDRGRVFLNGKKVVIASWELRAGDRLEILPEGGEDPTQSRPNYLKVVYEDSDLLVVEKDAGTSCEKSAVAWRPSMVAMVNQYLKKTHPFLPAHYVGLVHRLDTDTSGLLIYSKTREANRVTEQFKKQKIVRKYLAVVAGRVAGDGGCLEGYLAPADLSHGRKVRLVPKGKGKRAETLYQVLERYGTATLLEMTLKTGRTHQIRAQLSDWGHPVVGDKIYGNGRMPFKRQALHAHFLRFRHPVTRQMLDLTSPLPKDLRRLVERLRQKA